MQEIKFLELNQYRKSLIELMKPLNTTYAEMAEARSFHEMLDSGIVEQAEQFSEFLVKHKLKPNVLLMMFIMQLRGYGISNMYVRQTVKEAKKESKAQLLVDLDMSFVVMRDVNFSMQKLSAEGVLLDSLKIHLPTGDSFSSSDSEKSSS